MPKWRATIWEDGAIVDRDVPVEAHDYGMAIERLARQYRVQHSDIHLEPERQPERKNNPPAQNPFPVWLSLAMIVGVIVGVLSAML